MILANRCQPNQPLCSTISEFWILVFSNFHVTMHIACNPLCMLPSLVSSALPRCLCSSQCWPNGGDAENTSIYYSCAECIIFFHPIFYSECCWKSRWVFVCICVLLLLALQIISKTKCIIIYKQTRFCRFCTNFVHWIRYDPVLSYEKRTTFLFIQVVGNLISP